MLPHIRAMIAASAHAFIMGRKVAGLYDHTAGQHLRIAAESRKEHLQGYDGDRDVRFGGTLPEIRGTADSVRVHMVVQGSTAVGYDRSSSGHFTAEVTERLVQLYDHIEGVWFAYDEMDIRRFGHEMQRNYIRDVGRFATFLGRSPDTATTEDRTALRDTSMQITSR